MATEIVEYRPGKWVKVVDGHIVGRATPEEVAAWQQAARAQSPAALDIDLDIDLSPGPPAGPAHALDISRRPAFERRGRPVQPATSGPPGDGAQADGHPPAPPPGGEQGKVRATPAATQPKPAAMPERTGKVGPLRQDAGKPGEPAGRAAREHLQAADRAKPVIPSGRPSVPPTERSRAADQPALTRQASRRPADGGTGKDSAAKAPASQGAVAEEPESPPARSEERSPGYWWVWNARHQPVEAFLKEWLPRYKEKFGREATLILCHEDDLAAVEACGYNAEVSPLLQPGHFYLGHGNGE